MRRPLPSGLGAPSDDPEAPLTPVFDIPWLQPFPDARFEVGDAMSLPPASYDAIVDSALFHIFDAADRTRYVRSLHDACRPGGLVHVLALSDEGPQFGPEVSESDIRSAFGDGWELEALDITVYRGVIGESQAETFDQPVGSLVDLPAWLARARRL